MDRIVIIGNDKPAKLIIEHALALNPDLAFTVFGPPLASREANWFKKYRVDLRQGIRATEIDRFARRVTGNDGTRIMFDRLILTEPCPELARSAKLQVSSGVLVNTYMQTSDGYVYALGDSVECPAGMSLGSLHDHARIIARHICSSSPQMFAAAEVEPRI